MNVFSYVLAQGDIDAEPAHDSGLVVDDNIGEGVHVHYRNVRLEFSIDDYLQFGEECELAVERLQHGNR